MATHQRVILSDQVCSAGHNGMVGAAFTCSISDVTMVLRTVLTA
jgi:hypothetical protein